MCKQVNSLIVTARKNSDILVRQSRKMVIIERYGSGRILNFNSAIAAIHIVTGNHKIIRNTQRLNRDIF